MKSSLGAVALVTTCIVGSSAFASTVNTISNVVFIVDESGSMAGEQAFLANTVIGSLDADLATAGVTSRSYGVVGFGGFQSGSSFDPPRLVGTPGLNDATTTQANLNALVTTGGFEDGYAAIDFALNNFNFTSGAAVNFILVTDEDRDVTPGTSFTAASITNTLTSSNILLNAVVSQSIDADSTTPGPQTGIGVDSDGNAYVADGMGGFTTSTTGQLGSSASGTTQTDYSDVALATGGAVWDLNQLRAGGPTAQSFAEAFIEIKVSEIISQPPTGPAPIPLPAAGWMLLAGLGGLVAMRRRQSA